MRPSLAGTIFPVVAFIVGVAVGAYLPRGILPGTSPTQPDGSPAPPPPTPMQAFEQLWDEITAGLGDGSAPGNAAGSGATGPNAAAGNAASGNTGGTGATGTQPGDPQTPAAIAAERSRLNEYALRKLNRTPLLLVGIINGRTVLVQEPDGGRYPVALEWVDQDHPDIARQLQRFVGQRVSLDLVKPVVNDSLQLVALVHILPLTWTEADGAPTDDRYSLNAAIHKALKKN